jgi:hypothetical protein
MKDIHQERNEPATEFEKALASALRPVNPPERVARFLALAAEVEAERHQPRRERTHRWAFALPRPQRWLLPSLGTAVAAALAVGVFAGEQLHRRHQQELADRQFDTAVRVTDHALENTRAQLLRSGIRLPD